MYVLGAPNDYYLKISFSYFTPEVRLFFVEKRKPKIFGLKNVVERDVKVNVNIILSTPLRAFQG